MLTGWNFSQLFKNELHLGQPGVFVLLHCVVDMSFEHLGFAARQPEATLLSVIFFITN